MSDIAPAAPAPAAPAAAPAASAPAEAAPTAPASGAAPSDDVGGGAQPAGDPWYSGFDWDTWDGSPHSLTGAAPQERQEELGGLIDKISSYHASSFSGRERQLNELMEVYTSMLDGAGDPRVDTLTSDLETARKELETLQGQHQTATQQAEAYQAEANQDYVKRFWSTNTDLRTDDARLGEFVKYLDDGEYGSAWDPYVAIEVMGLNDTARQIAIEARRNGTPDDYALKLGKAHDQISATEQSMKQQQAQAQAAVEKKASEAASKPRPAARITAGADRATVSRPAERSISEAKTIEDMRNMAAERALRVHRGGRR